MLQTSGDGDLAREALGAECGRELLSQHLDGDLALVLQVFGKVDRCHATLPELALEAVPVGEGGGESFEGGGQDGSGRGTTMGASVFEKSSPKHSNGLSLVTASA